MFLLPACPAVAYSPSLPAQAYQDQVRTAERLVEACSATAAVCDPAALPVDAEVQSAGGTDFRASWLWLREAVGAARKAPASERMESMRAAEEHLVESARLAGSAGSPGSAFGPAQDVAAGVLARPEFQPGAGPTWLDRQFAKLQDWFLRLLLSMDRIGAHNPWIAPLIEWSCFLLAGGGLVFFIRRSLARSALRIALGSEAAAQVSPRDATDWARAAEQHRAAGAWREAIHCLYWAAIVSLEGRRAWRANPTRTPREYLRLLAPASAARAALAGLTRSFERVWYGHAEATESDFRTAEMAYAALGAADLKRNTEAGSREPDGLAASMGAP